MPHPGTVLANTVLARTGLRHKLARHYTYKRAKDRSYKMWGSFTEVEAARLILALAAKGASNPRVSYAWSYGGRKVVSGVRFELPVT